MKKYPIIFGIIFLFIILKGYRLEKKKIKILVVFSKKNSKDDEGMQKIAISIHSILNKSSEINSKLISVNKLLFNVKSAEIIHFIGGPSLKTFILSFLCKKLNPTVKTILTFTNPIFNKFQLKFIKFFKPDIALISSSKWRKILSQNKINYKFLNVSGINQLKFKKINNIKKKKLKIKYKLPLKKKIILHIGHLKKKRNIEIFKLLKGEDFKVVIVGSTITKQEHLLIKELKKEKIIVINKYIKNIFEIYQISDLYVFPVLDHENAIQVPLSVLEALSCNLPVLSTKFGGLPDILPSNKFNISYSDPNKLGTFFNKNKMLKLIKEKKKNNMKKFQWEEITKNLVSIYKNANQKKN